MDQFLPQLFLKMSIVFFCVSWINTLFIHYCYLKVHDTNFTKQMVKSAYISSMICTLFAMFSVRVFEIIQ